jgi:hypothetical protein
MPKAYSLDLRERVAGFIDSGRLRHAAAAHCPASAPSSITTIIAVIKGA